VATPPRVRDYHALAMADLNEAQLSDPGARAQRHRILRVVARWGLVVILIGVAANVGLAIWSLRGGATDVIESVSPGWLVLAAVLSLVPIFTHAARIRLWSGFLGAPTTFLQSLRASFGTELGSSVSPKAIGGAPVKIGMLVESGQTTGMAASIVLLDNIEDIVFFAFIAPGIAFATARWEIPEVQEAIQRVGGKVLGAAPWILGLAALIAAIVWWRRRQAERTAAATTDPDAGTSKPSAFQKARSDFVAAYALIGRRGKLRFLFAMLLTTFHWFARCSVGTAILYGVGAEADPVLFFLLQWVVFATMVFVPTPGAALGAEASFAAIMDGFVAEGLLGLVTAGWRFLSFYFVLLVGLIAVPLLGRMTRDRA
jgi:uncharacterized protein (TIRG00374 family)